MAAICLDSVPEYSQRTTARVTSCSIRASDLPHPHVRFAALAAALGFDGASYFLFGAVGKGLKPAAHWSTAGHKWYRTYERHALHCADPRLVNTDACTTPVVWNAQPEAIDPATRRFSLVGARFGIASGVALSICDDQMGRAVMCWDFAAVEPCPERLRTIGNALDTLTLVSGLLLESVWSRPYLHPQSRNDDACLTARECECLALAANGMTSADISIKLGISQRTANFHFGNIIAKLHALNRGEAIARAIVLGLYRPPPRTWVDRT